MPTRCTTWFRSICHTSSANAHHAASKLSATVIPCHGPTDPPGATCQFTNVRQPAMAARTVMPTTTGLRLRASMRRSTPPSGACRTCQPEGTLGDSDGRVSMDFVGGFRLCFDRCSRSSEHTSDGSKRLYCLHVVLPTGKVEADAAI